MPKNNTTHEQAEKLIQLGIDISTADMHFHRMPNQDYETDGNEYIWIEYPKFDQEKHFNEAKRPCWSLSALFDMLPNWIDVKSHEDSHLSQLHIYKKRILYQYHNLHSDLEDYDVVCYGDTFFDCVYNAVLWLIENKNVVTYVPSNCC